MSDPRPVSDPLTMIPRFHAALYEACGLEVPRITYSDERAWADFLFELRSLDETEGGPLALRDVIAVVSRMREDVRSGKGGWSLRPTRILRDPELFRDLVLESRRKLRRREPARPAPVARADAAGPFAREEEAAQAEGTIMAGEAAAEAIRAFKARLKGGGR